MSEAAAPRGTFTPNFNLNLPDIAGDWDIWGALTNDNWTFVDGAMLPIWGGQMTGLLTLFGDPVAPLGAATRRYVDAVAANQANYLPLAGGTLTGPLQVPQGSNAIASVQLGAANNGLYAPANGNVGIAAAGTAVFGSSSITARFFIPLVMGAALTLAGDPTAALGAATKQYVDAVSAQLGNYLPLAGGQLTGPLITAPGTGGSLLGIGIGNNTTGLWSSGGNALVLQTGGATNLYLSPTGNQMAQPLTMMGSATLTLAADAAQPMQAVTLRQMGAIVGGPYLPISGGVLTGALTLAADPTAALHAATKQYADTKLPLAGGTLTGALTLAADPTAALHAATKQYADTKLPLAGGALTGALGIGITPPANTLPAGLLLPEAGFYASGNMSLSCNAYLDNTAGTWRILANATDQPTLLQSVGGALTFYNTAAGAVGSGIGTWNTRFTVNNAGRAICFGGVSPSNDTSVAWYVDGSGNRITQYIPGYSEQWLAASGMTAWYANGAETMALQMGGTLTIFGAAYKPGGGAWADGSDSRIKNVLGSYTAGLDEILALRPIRYTHKGNWQRIHPNLDPEADDVVEETSLHQATAAAGTEFIGLVAQDAELVMPELVTQQPAMIDGTRVEDLRTLEAGPLVYALVNAVQQLAARVEALEARA